MVGAISEERNPPPYHENDDDYVASKEYETNSVRRRAQARDSRMDGVYALGWTDQVRAIG
jgi:hypothetical protein